jgi:RNA polymerase sigma-70 factor (ECF subfamily)
MEAMPPLDLDRLLSDTAFVRRIARALVRDPDAAEDLAQDAMVVAIERPPRAGTSPRGWLAAVVRSLAIDRARRASARARHESAAPDREPPPAPDEIIARLDLSRRVSDALRELEEPYRTALYLRYVEELDPASIAERLSVPLATVKTRLRRGLEILRARFDREWGGRAAWSAVLVPLASHPTNAGLGAGAFLMGTWIKIAAALLVCGAAAWLSWPKYSVVPLASGPLLAPMAGVELADAQRDDVRKPLPPAGLSAPDSPGTDAKPGAGPHVRVLDERRFPVAGAHVLLHVRGFGDDEAVTDAEGVAHFTNLPKLEEEARRATLLAWDDRGRAAARLSGVRKVDASTNPADAEAGRKLEELVLQPGSSLEVRVVSAGRPAAGAKVRLESGAMRTAVLDAVADAEGRAIFEKLPATMTLVQATRGDHEARAETVLAAGRIEKIVLALQPARTVDVRVVDAKSKAPVPDARLNVYEMFDVTDDGSRGAGMRGRTYMMRVDVDVEVAPTDENGRTRIRGLPSKGMFEVAASADLYSGADSFGRAGKRIPTESDSLVIELQPLNKRTVRWPIETGEVDPPADGTVLTLRKETVDRYNLERYSPLPTSARIEGAEIVAADVLDKTYSFLAITPDGSLARLWIEDGAESGKPVSFRRPRRIEVTVLDAQGSPAPGVKVWVTNEGNNLLLPEATTDAAGTVTFEGLYGRRANVQAAYAQIGSVDLEKGDGEVEGRLAGTREIALRLRLDGDPGLPSTYSVAAGGMTRTLSEDPALGILRLQIPRSAGGGSQKINVSAAGYLPASVELAESTTADTVVDVDLRRAGSLLARVSMPPTGKVRIRCEPWDAEKNQWYTATAGTVSTERFAPNAPDDGFLFEDLPAGLYRVRDVDSELASETVEVFTGGPRAEVDLDLSSVVRVRGILEGPEGALDWRGVVAVEGENVAVHQATWKKGSEFPEGHRIDAEGKFDFVVPASKPVTLRASHPYFVPDPRHGRAVIAGENLDVRLKLVRGDEVQIPLAPFQGEPKRGCLRVYAYCGEPVGEPDAWFCGAPVEGVARFTGLEHGTWNLWIDSDGNLAPAIVRGVQVGPGITRVDAHPPAGCSLRVRLLNVRNDDPPRIYVSAEHESEPMHMRSINSGRENPVVLKGIGKGTYRVRVNVGIGTNWSPQDRTIEFDGTTDVEIEVDAAGAKGS